MYFFSVRYLVIPLVGAVIVLAAMVAWILTHPSRDDAGEESLPSAVAAT